MTVFSVGGVIQREDKILDIVPEQDSLTIEAQIAVEDVSDVHPNMCAEVHLTAYNQRIVPMIHGEVIQISADRLTDPKTNNPYYTVFVRVDQDELAATPNIRLYPGMPATIMIPTVQRTAFEYIVGPLIMSFNQSFRQGNSPACRCGHVPTSLGTTKRADGRFRPAPRRKRRS
nr:HlyD family efflux transporter periplasmic adaptor subunit [Bradyrhizobium canariense]